LISFARDGKPLLTFFLLVAISFFSSCKNSSTETPVANQPDTLTEKEKHEAKNGLKGLVAFNGLEVQTMATEPMLQNPTNIDVDDRGRVWVTEAYNYRPR
jgi:hypothetical protein